MTIYLDFEKDLAEVHSKISDLEGYQIAQVVKI